MHTYTQTDTSGHRHRSQTQTQTHRHRHRHRHRHTDTHTHTHTHTHTQPSSQGPQVIDPGFVRSALDSVYHCGEITLTVSIHGWLASLHRESSGLQPLDLLHHLFGPLCTSHRVSALQAALMKTALCPYLSCVHTGYVMCRVIAKVKWVHSVALFD